MQALTMFNATVQLIWCCLCVIVYCGLWAVYSMNERGTNSIVKGAARFIDRLKGNNPQDNAVARRYVSQ